MAKIQPEFEAAEIHLTLSGRDLDITPENTRITQHIMGKVALDDVLRDSTDFDNIRIDTGDEIDGEYGAWIFRPDEETNPQGAEGFEDFLRMLIVHGFPIRANVTEVDDGALYAFQKKIDQDAESNSTELIDELTEFLKDDNK